MRSVLAALVGATLLLALYEGLGHKIRVQPGTIVFLGDSITAGYGLDPQEAYPSLIEISGMTTLNSGVSGNTSADGLQRLRNYFASGETARLVVIALGANDILHGVSPEDTESNLESSIAECKTRGIPVLLCGISIPWKFGSDSIFTDVARHEHVPLMKDILLGDATHEDLMQEDHMHPNAAGQKLIAKAMQAELLKYFSFSAK